MDVLHYLSNWATRARDLLGRGLKVSTGAHSWGREVERDRDLEGLARYHRLVTAHDP